MRCVPDGPAARRSTSGCPCRIDPAFDDETCLDDMDLTVSALMALTKPGTVSVVCSQGYTIPALIEVLAPRRRAGHAQGSGLGAVGHRRRRRRGRLLRGPDGQLSDAEGLPSRRDGSPSGPTAGLAGGLLRGGLLGRCLLGCGPWLEPWRAPSSQVPWQQPSWREPSLPRRPSPEPPWPRQRLGPEPPSRSRRPWPERPSCGSRLRGRPSLPLRPWPVRPCVAAAFLAGALASFFAPLVIALNSAPARNAGTSDFLTFTVAPVAGLRAVRAARSRRSKTPKPVSATFSPRETAW